MLAREYCGAKARDTLRDPTIIKLWKNSAD